jgi:DNA-binding winged helix-turn-helix (wHTH) protein
VRKPSIKSEIKELLKYGQVRSEKCELKESGEAYLEALKLSKSSGDLRLQTEALAGLLRLAGEALDREAIRKWDTELDRLISTHPKKISPLVWYCKGAVAIQNEEWKLAQRHFHRYLRTVRTDSVARADMPLEEHLARAWTCLANIQRQLGHLRRAEWICQEILRRYEEKKFRSINGLISLMLGTIAERRREFPRALQWFQKAHANFLGEHNWYHHLYVLYGYARLARVEQNYSQAYWYLDLIDKAAAGPEFGILRREIVQERSRLEKDAVDLLIDSQKGIIKTRESGPVMIRKQYVLLNILEALSASEKGLSKAEIIEKVWRERYRPEAHDNKLYYNINRLRKLIEPDVHKPQYLLNWKEGYRLAPGLRVHLVGGGPE